MFRKCQWLAQGCLDSKSRLANGSSSGLFAQTSEVLIESPFKELLLSGQVNDLHVLAQGLW